MFDLTLFEFITHRSEIREFLESIRSDADKQDTRLYKKNFFVKNDSLINYEKQINSYFVVDSRNSIKYDLSEFYVI
jgi:hypothetical protein